MNTFNEPTIYVASKVKHAPKWIALRAAGYQINSTWIDEAGPGQSKCLKDLAIRCIEEPKLADLTIVYREEGETLKGALVEMGAALAGGKTVILVGAPALKAGSAFRGHPNVHTSDTFEEAVDHYQFLRNFYTTYDHGRTARQGAEPR